MNSIAAIVGAAFVPEITVTDVGAAVATEMKVTDIPEGNLQQLVDCYVSVYDFYIDNDLNNFANEEEAEAYFENCEDLYDTLFDDQEPEKLLQDLDSCYDDYKMYRYWNHKIA